jgi:D-alanyl-D-alanine carboxypeptidase
MRSGVAEFADADVLGAYYRRPLATFTAQDALRLAAAKAASFTAPNEQTVYINTNYVLLERIVERVSGQDMDAYLQAHVMGPLGMRRTFYATGPVLPSLLHGYSLERAAPPSSSTARGSCSSDPSAGTTVASSGSAARPSTCPRRTP